MEKKRTKELLLSSLQKATEEVDFAYINLRRIVTTQKVDNRRMTDDELNHYLTHIRGRLGVMVGFLMQIETRFLRKKKSDETR